MKTTNFLPLAGCTIFLLAMIIFLCSYNMDDKGNAVVNQQDGLYIFLMSKPAANFDNLGSVKKGFALSGEPTEMLNSMIKKVKKDYPSADGIIFTSIAMEKADAIKLK